MRKRDMILGVIGNALGYNIVEVTLVAIIGIVHWKGGDVHSWFLWLAFIAAALWTVLASTEDAQEEALELVLHREVFITDYLLGAFSLLVLSVITMRYGLHFSAIFFVAAIQNLRYSALAYDWLKTKEENDKHSERNNLP